MDEPRITALRAENAHLEVMKEQLRLYADETLAENERLTTEITVLRAVAEAVRMASESADELSDVNSMAFFDAVDLASAWRRDYQEGHFTESHTAQITREAREREWPERDLFTARTLTPEQRAYELGGFNAFDQVLLWINTRSEQMIDKKDLYHAVMDMRPRAEQDRNKISAISHKTRAMPA